MRHRRHAGAAAVSRVSAGDIAQALGLPRNRVDAMLRRYEWMDFGRRIQYRRTTYDSSAIDKLRALLGQEINQYRDPELDWLSRHLGGTDASPS